MRRSLAVAIFLTLSVLPVSLSAQQPAQSVTAPSRDAQATAALQQAFAAMGGTLPSDTVATGTVTIVAGSQTESGDIRIQTRNANQTTESIQAGPIQKSVVYSGGLATETNDGTIKTLPLERSLSSQSAAFPLSFVYWALNDPDASVTYIGTESLNGMPAIHVRLVCTFVSQPGLQPLKEFTTRDLWIASGTGLPLKMAYERRESGGSSPHILVAVNYSDYQNSGGILYPFQIQQSLNGTAWMTIQIFTVNVNTGLSDSDFPLPAIPVRSQQ